MAQTNRVGNTSGWLRRETVSLVEKTALRLHGRGSDSRSSDLLIPVDAVDALVGLSATCMRLGFASLLALRCRQDRHRPPFKGRPSTDG